MKIPIRYFSIGLLTASIVLFIMYLVTDDSSQVVDDLSVEELSTALEQKGYRTISQDDFISYSMYLDEERAKDDKKEKADKPSSDKKDEAKDKQKNNEKQQDDKKTKDEKPDADQDEDKEKDDSAEKEVDTTKKATINVEQGFVSQDIAKLLKNQGIIDNESEFAKYMEDNGYSSYIQIGKFTVNSDMTSKQLAETLTTYPGN